MGFGLGRRVGNRWVAIVANRCRSWFRLSWSRLMAVVGHRRLVLRRDIDATRHRQVNFCRRCIDGFVLRVPVAGGGAGWWLDGQFSQP